MEAIIHEGYRGATNENDVCLLHLESDFDFSDG